jgi:hypothetical protein
LKRQGGAGPTNRPTDIPEDAKPRRGAGEKGRGRDAAGRVEETGRRRRSGLAAVLGDGDLRKTLD